jgi:hypothetical protein
MKSYVYADSSESSLNFFVFYPLRYFMFFKCFDLFAQGRGLPKILPGLSKSRDSFKTSRMADRKIASVYFSI